MAVVFFVVYILIAALAVFLLIVFAERLTNYSRDFDVPWPIFAGIFWPIGAPIAAAYIAAYWFLHKYE